MNKELKEQAMEDIMTILKEKTVIAETDDECSITGLIYKKKINYVLDSLIEKTVQSERDRIVGIIEKQRLIKTSNEGGVDFMIREAGNAIINDIISLITNKSDINSNK